MKLLLGIVFASIVAILHYAAISFFWYWKFPWFDILMHGLGGALIAYLAILIIPKKRFIIPTVLVIAVLWEVFEWYFGIVYLPYKYYTLDTTIDLIMDIVGAGIVIGAYHLWRNRT